ncbi:MAG: dihydroorotase family protein [Thermodesulfobacteriota bacterium]
MDVVLKNCKVVKPTGIYETGIGIENERIVMLAPDSRLPESDEVIDAGGRYVLPGLVDSHMHFPWPPADDFANRIESETKACLYGGCTTAVHMLRGSPDISEETASFINLFEQNAFVDAGLNAMILSREHVEQIRRLAESGMRSFKFYLPYRVGTRAVKGLPQLDDGILYLGFQEIGRLSRTGHKVHARVHCENPEIHSRIREMYRGRGHEPGSWHEVRPSICETESMVKTIHLARATDCPVTIIHMSTKESVDLLADLKGNHPQISGETCPQYLVLNVKNTDRNLGKVNPPIREEADNRRLWEALDLGILDIVGTDHWPVHSDKKQDFWRGEVGLSTVECWLAVLLSEGVNKGRISIKRLVEMCCYNPARIFGLAPRKGMIEVGADADLVLVDLGEERVVGDRPVYSDSDYNIFSGWRLKGWPVLTMLRGKVVMRNGKIICGPGRGRYIASGNSI